jgi:hypothetical protein
MLLEVLKAHGQVLKMYIISKQVELPMLHNGMFKEQADIKHHNLHLLLLLLLPQQALHLLLLLLLPQQALHLLLLLLLPQQALHLLLLLLLPQQALHLLLLLLHPKAG